MGDTGHRPAYVLLIEDYFTGQQKSPFLFEGKGI
jgi:hypothetical protein